MALPATLVNEGNVVDDTRLTTQQGDTHSEKNSTENSTSVVLHRSLYHDPLRVISAEGNYLKLSNGQQILDATGGAAVACLGHGNERYFVVRNDAEINI